MKKFLTVLCDGMADRDDLRGLTPMDEAHTPNMDMLCELGETGLVHTVPHGLKPGSDVCNLAALGYDAAKCYTGRSPLEALSMGIELGENDVTLRTNLVTLSDGDALCDRTMLDYSAGEISSAEAAELVAALSPLFAENGVELYAGVGYRHAAVIRGIGNTHSELTPPHDILDRKLDGYLPGGILGERLTALIERSTAVLAAHPVNLRRIASGKRPASAAWFWGEGTKPRLQPFAEKFGKTAAVVSAVDLVKGIGIAGGMEVVDVPTATGTYNTDYEAKAAAAISALERNDFCFVHLEGPDECGHQGDRRGKIAALERIDGRILAPLYKHLSARGEPFAICVMPDHATPLSIRTHSAEPIPYLIYDSEREKRSGVRFSEKLAATTGVVVEHGYDILPKLFGMK